MLYKISTAISGLEGDMWKQRTHSRNLQTSGGSLEFQGMTVGDERGEPFQRVRFVGEVTGNEEMVAGRIEGIRRHPV